MTIFITSSRKEIQYKLISFYRCRLRERETPFSTWKRCCVFCWVFTAFYPNDRVQRVNSRTFPAVTILLVPVHAAELNSFLINWQIDNDGLGQLDRIFSVVQFITHEWDNKFSLFFFLLLLIKSIEMNKTSTFYRHTWSSLTEERRRKTISTAFNR